MGAEEDWGEEINPVDPESGNVDWDKFRRMYTGGCGECGEGGAIKMRCGRCESVSHRVEYCDEALVLYCAHCDAHICRIPAPAREES